MASHCVRQACAANSLGSSSLAIIVEYPACIQILKGKVRGECSDFEATSGHGLKCSVSGVESHAQDTTREYTKGLRRQVVVKTDHSLMTRDKTIAATPTRHYKVSELAR